MEAVTLLLYGRVLIRIAVRAAPLYSSARVGSARVRTVERSASEHTTECSSGSFRYGLARQAATYD